MAQGRPQEFTTSLGLIKLFFSLFVSLYTLFSCNHNPTYIDFFHYVIGVTNLYYPISIFNLYLINYLICIHGSNVVSPYIQFYLFVKCFFSNRKQIFPPHRYHEADVPLRCRILWILYVSYPLGGTNPFVLEFTISCLRVHRFSNATLVKRFGKFNFQPPNLDTGAVCSHPLWISRCYTYHP